MAEIRKITNTNKNMRKVIYIALIALVLGGMTSCSNKLCPAYGSYPKSGR